MDGKCFESDSEIQPKECLERLHGEIDGISELPNEFGVDRISRLPDDILVVILSFLSLREAVTTSVLSSRWPDLWKHTSNLNFNNKVLKINPIDHTAGQGGSWDPERCNYIEIVNSVLQSHKAPFLKEFKISLCVNKSAQSTVAKWLEFVFSRKVGRLELNFNCWEVENRIVLQELLKESRICWDRNLIIFGSLKSLFLGCLQMSGEDVNFFLCKLPLLEQLTIYSSKLTSDVEICGANLMLKYLEIHHCFGGKLIKVSAPNLTWLVANVGSITLLVENVPKLVGVRFSSTSKTPDRVQHVASAVSCCISQVEIFDIIFCHSKVFPTNRFPEMPKLKKLVICYFHVREHDVLPVNALIWAAPHLQEFVLTFVDVRKIPSSCMEVITNVEESPHRHLKVFEFKGFCGAMADHVQLVTYISNNCVALQKIVIDCRPPASKEVCEIEVQIAKEYAKDQLQGKVSHHIQLLFP